MSEPTQLPQAAVIITQEVADWDVWKTHFDGHEAMRKAAGILGHHINRALDNPNVVSVYLAVSDVDKARAFAGSADLRSTMAAAGVKGVPAAQWVRPAAERIVWHRELPAILISHHVADFDAWLAGYNAAADVRLRDGIVGDAANQSIDDPSLVVVYHQAESHDALKAFLADPGLREAMQKAGVTSAPQVTFVTGGWAKRY